MQAKLITIGGTDFVHLSGCGSGGTADQQIGVLIGEAEKALAAQGMALDNAVLHRIFAADRESREGIYETRARLLAGTKRTASSSFIAPAKLVPGARIALEMIAFRPKDPKSRRIVEFDPPRRYAHYVIQDRWMFLSGMAEGGNNMDAQFARSLRVIETALGREKTNWSSVTEITIFLERGHGSVGWLREKLANALPFAGRVTVVPVDGLASTDKHIEIEAVARLP
jgi:enamine deaminase RidA (YjgF/YER057c/UK114 family)